MSDPVGQRQGRLSVFHMWTNTNHCCVCRFATFGSSGVSVLSTRLKERSRMLRLTTTTCFVTFWPNISDPSFTFFCMGSCSSSWNKPQIKFKELYTEANRSKLLKNHFKKRVILISTFCIYYYIPNHILSYQCHIQNISYFHLNALPQYVHVFCDKAV